MPPALVLQAFTLIRSGPQIRGFEAIAFLSAFLRVTVSGYWKEHKEMFRAIDGKVITKVPF